LNTALIPPSGNPRARVIAQRYGAAKAHRVEREGLWKELQHVIQPTALSYTENQASADARERRLLDSTGAQALELFGSFLLSEVFMAGTADAAFRFVPAKPNGRPIDPSRMPIALMEWMQEAAFAVTASLYSGARSAVPALHAMCLDLGLYGSGCIGVWKSKRGPAHAPINYRHYSVWQVAADMADGHPMAIYIQDKMSKRAAMARWPEKAHLFANADDGSLDAVEMIYACVSAEDPDLEHMVGEGVRALGKPWYGVWVYGQHVVEEMGYNRQPVIFAPWYSVDNTAWGRSPAMTALGDVFMAQNLSEVTLRGAEKLVDPPMQVRDGALMSPLRLYPGGITYTDTVDNALSPMLPAGASRIEVGAELLRDRQARIERAFFVPLFQSSTPPGGSKQPRTAYEVAIDKDERNRAVAPMVLRLMGLVLEPLVQRVLDLLIEARIVPRPPIEEGVQLLIVSNSPLVIALQQTRMAGLERFIQGISLLAQATSNLEVLDRLDGDAAAKIMHAAMNAPAKVLRDDATVAAIRQRRIEQQQAMAAAETAAVNAKAAADILTAANKAGIIGT